mmetsp:Transcript_17725/g.25009  ORF Transcript_17725/g.25009 Transcript_17725/m.25009 type:complete len:507 (+) Transcript_17725:86-1606(+)
MDQFQTEKERRDKWYARHISPKYVPIVPVHHNELLHKDDTSTKDIHMSKIHEDKCQQRHFKAITSSTLGSWRYAYSIKASLFDTAQSDTEGDFDTVGKTLLNKHLSINGFAVISDVLSHSECDVAIGLAWDYLEAASAAEYFLRRRNKINNDLHGTNRGHGEYDDKLLGEDENKLLDKSPPVNRDNANSHFSEFFPRSVEGRIYPFYGSGHSTFGWFIRSCPRIREIFSSVNGLHHSHNSSCASCIKDDRESNEMITSFDGMILWRSGEQYFTDAGWFHVDQNPRTKPNFCAVQGLVNLLPVTKETGGNVIVARSHSKFPQQYISSDSNKRLHQPQEDDNCKKFYSQRLDEVGGDDWLEIDPMDKDLLVESDIITLMLRPGDMLLWDSRTVHCSYPATKCHSPNKTDSTLSNFHNKYGLVRAAGLVSMMPRSSANDDVIKRRIEACQNCRTLTHWANKVAPLGGEKTLDIENEELCIKFIRSWQFKRNHKVLLSYDDLTKIQKSLV